MNANGNKLDVWLIYRCEKCDTSWNMNLYKRSCSWKLGQDLYNRFLENDADTALDSDAGKILSRNKAEALWEQVPFKGGKKRSMRPKMPVRHWNYAERMISAENGKNSFRGRIVFIHRNPYVNSDAPGQASVQGN